MKSRSLRNLERELAFTLLGFLEHETSLANERGFGANAAELVGLKQALEQRLGRVAVTQPLESVAQLLEKRRHEVRESCRTNLVRNLGELVERHHATSGWIFLFTQNTEKEITRTPENEIENLQPDANRNSHNGRLTAVASYNAPSPTRTYSTIQSEGIVGYVARTLDAYLVNDDCALDPNYVPLVANSMSEVAVPIFSKPVGFREGVPELVGVINLEANYPNAFDASVPLQLATQSTMFSVDLLSLRALQERTISSFWHPLVHGWTFRNVFDAFCNAIAEALPTESGSASLACAAWYNDQLKKRLFVRGTAGFDFEYVKDRTLSSASAIGSACEQFSIGKLQKKYLQGHELVQDIREFRRRAKAKRMEMRSVGIFPFAITRLGNLDMIEKDPIASTLSIERGLDQSKTVGGALVFYSFEHQYGLEGISIPQLLNTNVGERLARLFANLVDQLRLHRLQAARCFFESKLKIEQTSARNPFETMVRCLKELFDADGVSVFTVQPSALARPTCKEKELRVRATTGLVPVGKPAQPVGELRYKIEEYVKGKNLNCVPSTANYESSSVEVHVGLTNFLAITPNVVLRKNDVLDVLEPVTPMRFTWISLEALKEMYFSPRNFLLESHAPGSGEHMRFLGVSVGTKECSEVFGVIRITRTSSRAPFTAIDEELLAGLIPIVFDAFESYATDASSLKNLRRESNELRLSISQFARREEMLDQLGVDLGNAFNRRFGNTALNRLLDSLDSLIESVKAIEGADDDGELPRLLDRLLLTTGGPSREEWVRIRKRLQKLIKDWRSTRHISEASQLVRRLQERRPASMVSFDCDIASILEDTVLACGNFVKKNSETFANDAVVLSCLRFLDSNSEGEETLKVISVYPTWSKEPGEEDLGDAVPRSRQQAANGWKAIDRMLPTTFSCSRGEVSQHKHRVHPLTSWVTYGALVPFTTFSCGRVVKAIVSVDLASQLEKNSEEEKAVLKCLALAASKCIWTFAASELSLLQILPSRNLRDWRQKVKERLQSFRAKCFVRKVTDREEGFASISLSKTTQANYRTFSMLYSECRTGTQRRLLSELRSFGCTMESEGEKLIFNVPLLTINGVFNVLEIHLALKTFVDEIQKILFEVRACLLQFFVLSHNDEVSRRAFLDKDFVYVGSDPADAINYWRLSSQISESD